MVTLLQTIVFSYLYLYVLCLLVCIQLTLTFVTSQIDVLVLFFVLIAFLIVYVSYITVNFFILSVKRRRLGDEESQ